MAENIALVVDDTPANHDFMVRLIAQTRLSVRGASDGKSALAQVADLNTLKLAVVDMKLPDMDGLQLTAALRARFPSAYIIIATMYDDTSLMEKAFASGCNVFLVKPHGFMELYKRLTTMDFDELRAAPYLVIDQFGLRPFQVATQGR